MKFERVNPAIRIKLSRQSANAAEPIAHILTLPIEIQRLVFTYLQHSVEYLPIPLAPLPAYRGLLQCAMACKQWKEMALDIYHQSYYMSRIIPHISMPELHGAVDGLTSEWARICLFALVCVRQREWGLGAPRLFHINTEKLLSGDASGVKPDGHLTSKLMRDFELKHPNPFDKAWSNIISCTMDNYDAFWELATGETKPLVTEESAGDLHPSAVDSNDQIPKSQQPTAMNSFVPMEYARVTRPRPLSRKASLQSSTSYVAVESQQSSERLSGSPVESQLSSTTVNSTRTGRLAPNQEYIPMMLRYSERMDIGSFLMYLDLGGERGSILLRGKPVGSVTDWKPFGNGKIIVWDVATYGCCSVCLKRLVRIQVCADCRVSQYCTRACQKKHWENGHRDQCRDLSFNINDSVRRIIHEEI